ncbi:ankyrin repeat domain-containing protein [Ferrimonas balearica]|uniref:ankyrin repeat domain-containing protein n=1 Tax=Ferrimonas balearica TaxID=44012 RepID=UPI001C9398E0|nr:ankyrin repeat domain-containing protein [Ferrimonas balearica]MBY5980905.1 hypothetical protein [Ferrimonas balearica]
MRYFLTLTTFLLFMPLSFAARLDVDTMQPGEIKRVSWEGYPVLIYRRTVSQIQQLKSSKTPIVDPNDLLSALIATARKNGNHFSSMLLHGAKDVEQKPTRSKNDEFLVVMGMTSYFGCYIELDVERGVFIDPCSDAEYGLDGRLKQRNKREYYHLFVPAHTYDGGILIIGEESKEAVEILDFSPDIMKLSIPDEEKLLEAIQWQKFEVASSLIKKQGISNYETVTGATALHVAAIKGSPQIIEDLVGVGFDVNHVGLNGVTPLQLALLGKHGNEDNVIALLQMGARTDAFCQQNRCTQSALEYLQDRYPSDSKAGLEQLLNELQRRAHQ